MGRGSVVISRSLGRRLKQLRLAAKKTHIHVEEARLGSRQTLARRERGEGPYKPADVRALCWLYGASAEETEELVALAHRTAEDRIYEDNSDLLPPVFGTYVDLEARADEFCTYQEGVMPGLLQTPDYARAVYRALRPPHEPEVIERYVSIRLARQRVVLDGPARIKIVLNEGVIVRAVGGADVAQGQLQHLLDLSKTRPDTDVRVLTFASGAHAALAGPFSLLRFDASEEPNVAYVEHPAGARLLDKPGVVAKHADNFEALIDQSIPIGEYVP